MTNLTRNVTSAGFRKVESNEKLSCGREMMSQREKIHGWCFCSGIAANAFNELRLRCCEIVPQYRRWMNSLIPVCCLINIPVCSCYRDTIYFRQQRTVRRIDAVRGHARNRAESCVLINRNRTDFIHAALSSRNETKRDEIREIKRIFNGPRMAARFSHVTRRRFQILSSAIRVGWITCLISCAYLGRTLLFPI